MPVSELASKITATEFRDWLCFFRMYDAEPSLDNYYAAQIAWTVASVNSPKEKIPFDTFLMRYEDPSEEPEEVSIEEATANSKAFWGALVGG